MSIQNTLYPYQQDCPDYDPKEEAEYQRQQQEEEDAQDELEAEEKAEWMAYLAENE